ncbi:MULTISPECIES: transposase [unclassified Methanoculleus]|uniref:transposase n=2 Tax=Methanoculleus TaxID=45989 RepID=UPI0025EBD99F|nr:MULTISPECIES: transposase [unclassified Methanoculleus]MCK9316910.1 transposase [Methanoculleus sp.]MDD2253309.1 transposase [Methanoculleus sp.]MDD2788171.1 transposase [Methanoculleus sp.]MDD3215113.1 transposase [Methanoculleus sp.]MDD4313127.1 transposase [Methanoculleus sp.]
MEEWVRTWLKEQRQKGERCIEIKEIQGKPYVYRSTSVYDRATRSPKKVSTYLGRLTKEHGLIAKGTRRAGTSLQPRSVYEHGNAALMAEELGELIPVLREAFPTCWQEIVALTFTRTAVYTPLARVGDTWGKLDNVLGITPDCNLGALSQVLPAIGSDHAAQQAMFRHLSTQAHQFVYDLSFVFSCSDIFNLGEFSNNTDNVWLRQINIALSVATDTRLPTMFRILPGTVGDAATLIASLAGSDTARTTLVLDRRTVSEANETLLQEGKIPFVVLQRRNNARYATRIHLTEHFFYRKQLIRAGKREVNGLMLYLYEDADLEIEEKKTLYRLLEVGQIDRETLNQRMKRAGRIMLLSSIVADPQEIYELYKSRNTVEDHFDAFKNLILADKPYLQDATAVFGHVFVGFLCFYLYCRIRNRIRQAGLSAHLSPEGLLLKLSEVYSVVYGDEKRITEVPEQVRGIAEKLNLEIPGM